ncbi:hypothetical protein [Spiroplasma endosymbiont of Nebria brevicollis]|uniref:hypothetical protein n=1 Tax=Spiroplasma endosymbiont of Nebria brevicollis TaxID=3066284 RepID=UPI00313C3051
MNNYLLSVDPSMKNTGFTLWENKKPIWIKSYSFENYFNLIFLNDYVDEIKNIIWNYLDCKAVNWMDFLDIYIERGTFHVKNGIGYETQEHLRGFIVGQFNKLLTKNMLISPKQWQNLYWNKVKCNSENNLYIYHDEIEKKYNNNFRKEQSIRQANELIKQNNWNITISNHDEADSLLIGWYYLNTKI